MEDERIIDLYWSRNESAVEETEKKYGVYCTSIAKTVLQNTEDAKECVNDTYLAAWNTIPPKRPAMLRTFLGKITRNLAFNKYRYDRRDKRGGGEVALVLEELGECVSDSATPDTEIERGEIVAEINNFLEKQSEKHRNIFVLRYWYFYSIGQIANKYYMSETNVYTTLSRLREKLHNHLTERGYEI